MNKEILETFIKVSQEFIGNSNSLHKLGTKSKQLENASTKQILDTLNLKDKEVIEKQYESYKELGGNSFVKDLVARVLNLPIDNDTI